MVFKSFLQTFLKFPGPSPNMCFAQNNTVDSGFPNYWRIGEVHCYVHDLFFPFSGLSLHIFEKVSVKAVIDQRVS